MNRKYNKSLLAVVVFLLIACIGNSNCFADAPVTEIAPYRFAIGSLELAYYRSHPLNVYNNTIERAIIMVHGADRNPMGAYLVLEDLALCLGQEDSTMIVAPQFLIEMDIDEHNPSGQVAFWEGGWRQGHKSLSTASNPRSLRYSSFTFVDEMIEMLANGNFPNLTQIVVVGHSAGGQFSNRYSAGSRMQETHLDAAGIDIRYVVANPSSYVYFNNKRRVSGTLDQFAVPSLAEFVACPDYDYYKYGLQYLNTYMNAVGTALIRSQYQDREVVFLLGELDTDPDDPWLSTDCPSMWQGDHRLERGTIYFNYLQYYFGSSILNKQSFHVIQDVGHSYTGTYSSYYGMKALFGYQQNGTLAPIMRVDADAPAGGDGLTWGTAFDNLKDALLAAEKSPGAVDEIWVANGTYKPDYGTGARRQSFRLLRDIEVYGGFAGIDSVSYPGGEDDRSQRDFNLNVTILSGDSYGDDNGAGDNSENSHHIVLGKDGSLIDGFTITAGNANTDGFTRAGGMYNVLIGTPRVSNCIFIDNSANYGGAIYNRFGAHSIITDCTFISNSATNGGAIDCYEVEEAATIISGCIFSNNTADGKGGAIYSFLATPEIINCTFASNSAGSYGGGLYASSSTLTIENSIFWGNSDAGGWDESAQLHIYSPAGTSVTYSCIAGLNVYSGNGNINNNPRFIDAGNDDYHLRSQYGRWNPDLLAWIYDGDNSPCIDAGKQSSDWTDELWPHGKRINMGAHGGTPEASMSSSGAGNVANLDNDVADIVSIIDLALFVDKWLYEDFLLAEDFNRDGFVDFVDYAIFNQYYEE